MKQSALPKTHAQHSLRAMAITTFNLAPSGEAQTKKAEKGTTPHESVVIDTVAVEEPLQIVYEDPQSKETLPISLTMRTPGDDLNLVRGLLYCENIITHKNNLRLIDHCGPKNSLGGQNVVKVIFHNHKPVESIKSQNRLFPSTASCGVCGKTATEALKFKAPFSLPKNKKTHSSQLIKSLPDKLRKHQSLFNVTGGLHGCGLFDHHGTLQMCCEDIGRHNAFDKLIGRALTEGLLPLRNQIVLFSGRVSFELIQKAIMAGCDCIAAVGAPSSLAIELAEAYGITLIGFLREGRFNIYAGNNIQ